MKIKMNVYRKRDGSIMLYANNDRKVSVGIGETGMPAPYGRNTTAGQRNLIESVGDYFRNHENVIEATPDFDSHNEPKARLGDFGDLYITDVATVGGVPTGADGAFLFKGGKLYALDCWVEV